MSDMKSDTFLTDSTKVTNKKPITFGAIRGRNVSDAWGASSIRGRSDVAE